MLSPLFNYFLQFSLTFLFSLIIFLFFIFSLTHSFFFCLFLSLTLSTDTTIRPIMSSTKNR